MIRLMFHFFVLLLLFVVGGCTQGRPAPVDYRGNYFYGKEGAVDADGNYLPKYSADNPAPASEYDSNKYAAPVQQYSAAASVDDVSSADLPAPGAAPAVTENKESLAPIDAMTPPQAADSYASLPAQTAATVSATPPQSFVWPVKGKVISAFATNKQGINIEARSGEPIRAAADGTVIYADNGIKDYGNMIVVQHGGGWVSSYAHTADMVVKKGDRVVQGQLIGFVGKTGNAASPQLHFAMRKNEVAVDPQSYLK